MNTNDCQNEIEKMIREIDNPTILKFLHAMVKDAFNDWTSYRQQSSE